LKMVRNQRDEAARPRVSLVSGANRGDHERR
jgi:hypothetical protein